eukprot:m.189498 g.189498  ORF g.189498 m.189498 type:complete len:147 (+) comp16745_c3_seq13:125-565(+)
MTVATKSLIVCGYWSCLGDANAVEAVRQKVESSAMKVQYLPVSGAFHTSLMAPAVPALQEALDNIEIRMPTISVFANTLGRPYESVEEIRQQLVKQVASPIMWQQTLEQVAKEGHVIYELGPKRQIKAMLRKISMEAFKRAVNVTV